MDFAAYSIPYVVNGTLACEIALKSALSIETSKKCMHYINKLYNELSDDYKNVILDKFTSSGLSPEDFQNCLNQSSDLFVKWRYFYESKGVSKPKYFYELVQAICLGMFSFSSLIERDDK